MTWKLSNCYHCVLLLIHVLKRLPEEDRVATISNVKKELLEMDEADSCEEAAGDAQEPPCKRFAFSRILRDDLEELTTRRSVLEKVNQEVDNYLQTYLVDIDQSPLEWRRREKS